MMPEKAYNKNYFKNITEHAVTPTVSVILILFLVVALAGIIYVIIFGLASSVEKTAYVATDAQIVNITPEIQAIEVMHRNGDIMYYEGQGDNVQYEVRFIVDTRDNAPVVKVNPSFLTSDKTWSPGDRVIIFNRTDGYYLTNDISLINGAISPSQGPLSVRIIDNTHDQLIANRGVGGTTGGGGGSEPIDGIEKIFLYGQRLSFAGDTISGPDATVVITGGLNTANTNLGAQIAVTTIYIDGDVDLSTGSAGLGSSVKPGKIYINGDLRLWEGGRNIYGDVYVDGNFDLKDARIHGNVFVNGDLTLGWTPYLAEDTRIYYTGTISHPDYYASEILAKCIQTSGVPGFTIPTGLPSLKPDDWYTSNGYVSGGQLTSGMKVYANSYSSTEYRPSATNVVIVAKSGDITITDLGGSGVSGVFFAPNGRVTFGGGSLQGLILSQDGFFVTSGGTDVIFKSIQDFISNPNDYPFQ